MAERALDIFTHAVHLPSDALAAYLDEVCGGNAELRAEVERLMQARSGVRAVDPEAEDHTTIDKPPTSAGELAGTMIGRYELLTGTTPFSKDVLVSAGFDGMLRMIREVEPPKPSTRRYQTSNGLAMDIKRYLCGEAVLAAPPSGVYRFKKLIRRNNGPVAAGALVAALLVLGRVGTSVGLVRAEKRRQAEAA